jgi:hypothetical protein
MQNFTLIKKQLKNCNKVYLKTFLLMIITLGGGLRQINTCRKVPLQVDFF